MVLLFVLMFQKFDVIIVTLGIPVHLIILQPVNIIDVIHQLQVAPFTNMG